MSQVPRVEWWSSAPPNDTELSAAFDGDRPLSADVEFVPEETADDVAFALLGWGASR